MKILLFKGKGVVSKLIQWQTRSEYSHAAVMVGETVYEAREFKGVRKIELGTHSELTPESFLNCHMFTVLTNDVQDKTIVDFLEKQVGKKYDYSSVARFVSRRQASRKASGKWFCSELVYAAFQQAGIDLLREGSIEPWAVSPHILSLSPSLILNEEDECRNCGHGISVNWHKGAVDPYCPNCGSVNKDNEPIEDLSRK